MKKFLINPFTQHLTAFLTIILVFALTVQAKETIYLSEIPDPQNKIAVVTNRSVLNLNNDSIIFESILDIRGPYELSYSLLY